MQSSPLSFYHIPHGPRLPQHDTLEHPQPFFLPECERPVSHPNKTTGKIIVQVIVFGCLDSKLEDKKFWG
jgi:hypothetical protein